MSQTPLQPERPARARNRILLLVGITALVSAGIAFGVTALLVNIFERKQEARNPFFRVVEITDTTVDPAKWGMNFPLQYDAYKRTVDMVRTKYGGSEALPRVPTPDDPRTRVSESRLGADPRLKVMWAGYAFATDFREERGHAYMLSDQTYTLRQRVAKQPGTCVNCHASTYLTYRELGNGNLFEGFAKLNQLPYPEARELVDHPISCIDCHDPDSMQLRVTRPAFIEAMRVVKNDPEWDPNVSATRQEMRAYVCGQCHVEYYFKGPEKRLVYPWANGLQADEVLAYYNKLGFSDWTHALTSAPVLKAQHPEYEMWSQGIHARSGVTCADCHMPYVRVGATKISDHHVRSPLLNINNACQTCHHFSEKELLARAENIQDKTAQMRGMALEALVELIEDIEDLRQAGTSKDELTTALLLQRNAQFLLDYVEAENSMGFHASQEAARILALSLNYSRQAQLAARAARKR